MRRPLRLRSLKNKLALVFCGITLLAMVGIWFYVVPQLESSLRAQRRDDLARIARVTVDPLRGPAEGDLHPKQMNELVRAIADSSDARVTLYGLQRSKGVPTSLWLVSDSAAQPQVDQSWLLALRAGRTHRPAVGFGELNGARVAQAAEPILIHGHTRWVALYSRSLAGVKETVDLIRRKLLYATAAAGLLAIIGAYLVSGSVA